MIEPLFEFYLSNATNQLKSVYFKIGAKKPPTPSEKEAERELTEALECIKRAKRHLEGEK